MVCSSIFLYERPANLDLVIKVSTFWLVEKSTVEHTVLELYDGWSIYTSLCLELYLHFLD